MARKVPGRSVSCPMSLNYLAVTPSLRIPLSEFELSFARSGGPGGQNVNKVNSKVILRWRVMDSPSLENDVRERFMSKYQNRLTVEGELVLTSQRYRDQGSNLQDCLDKLSKMLATVAFPPRVRRKTRPSAAVQRRRVNEKREHSDKKQQRRTPRPEDE